MFSEKGSRRSPAGVEEHVQSYSQRGGVAAGLDYSKAGAHQTNW